MTSSLKSLPALLVAVLALTLTGCVGGNVGDLMGSMGGGACGLIVLIADIWALIKIANSSADTGSKLLWGALVFFFPLGGLLIWYVAGPKG